MSKERWITKAPFDGPENRKKRGNFGRPICRWCGHEVPKGRRTWCSQKCIDDYLVRKSSADARRIIKKRDREICSICKTDLAELRRYFRKLQRINHIKLDEFWEIGPWTKDEVYGIRSLWDVDHITPVVEGGGQCGAEDLRTLCSPCHKQETRKLAGKRARTYEEVDQDIFRMLDAGDK